MNRVSEFAFSVARLPAFFQLFADGVGVCGAGLGFTLNIPLPVGTRDEEIERKYAELVLPALRAFKPDLLMISAGFDAHELDPLGQLRMTTEGFGRLTKTLMAEADTLCEGRVVLVTEGGYDLGAIANCLNAVITISASSTAS